MKLNQLMLVGGLSALLISTAVKAETADHAGHSMQNAETNHDSMSHGASENKMFLEKKEIDGYSVSFHVMAADEGMNHGGTHNLMIKIEQQGKVLKGVKVNSKVIYPDGSEESKALMSMGDWQMVGYDMQESGKHQLMVLFKTADGKKHFGGLYYNR